MKHLLLLLPFFLLTTSCASLKKAICDCEAPKAKTVAPTKERKPYVLKGLAPKKEVTEASSTKSTAKKKKAVAPSVEAIAVNPDDLKIIDQMTTAMDDYVYRGEEQSFIDLCKDSRFHCYLNDKKFPQERKFKKRKVPPFMTGSKMGLRDDDERVRLRYEFYP